MNNYERSALALRTELEHKRERKRSQLAQLAAHSPGRRYAFEAQIKLYDELLDVIDAHTAIVKAEGPA